MIHLTTLTGSTEQLITARREAMVSRWQVTGVARSDVERIDLSTDPLSRVVDLVGSATLFGPSRHGLVDHVEANMDVLDVLDAHGPTSDAHVVATFHGRVPAKVSSRLAGLGSVVPVTTPTRPQDRAALVRSLGESAGVNLRPAQAMVVAERTDGDWGRVTSVIDQLAIGGFSTPTDAQLTILLGSSTSDQVPWGVTDAAARGARHEALVAAIGLEPVSLSSWVVAETLRLAEIVEHGWTASEAAAVLSIHSFRAEKLVRWARRTRPERLAPSLRAAARLDLAAKGSRSEAVATAALADWLTAVCPTPA